MSSFEFNKIFAAILIAGITAMLGGFIAGKLIHPHDLEEDAVMIEGGAVEGAGGPAVEAKAEPILHLIATADLTKGEKLSKACAACHSFDKGGPNKVGPNLWNIYGKAKGKVDGFSYSENLIAKGGSWSPLSLNKFLWKPKSYIEGTKMNYLGLKKPEDRAAMVAWLRTLSDSPKALPSEADIAAELNELAPPVLDLNISEENVELNTSDDEGAEADPEGQTQSGAKEEKE